MENNKFKKSIDVIIPVYNQEKFITESIKSVENQILKPDHIFVINDGSTDSTESVVLEYKDKCSIPLSYIKKENSGPNSARNIGLKNSNADFVAFLDADDVWLNYKLEEQINIFQNSSFKNLGLVYGRYDAIDKDSNPSKDYVLDIDTRLRGSAYNTLLEANKILGSASCVLIKKEVFNTVGIFDENLRFAEDWEMWLRISKEYEIDYSEKILVHIRRHPQNTSNSIIKQVVGLFKFYIKLLKVTKNPTLIGKLVMKRFLK